MQSTEISGATIHIDASLLPIRNLPVQKLELTEASVADDGLLAQSVDAAFATGSRLYGSGPGGEAANGAGNGAGNEAPFAVALSGLRYCSYSALQRLSERIASAYKRHCPHAGALVVICENDMAKALGQSLAALCGGQPRIICIDQVKVEHGDYLDLGEPISGTMIPVIVKTLVFQ
jgi:ethanolamine utilization protein EutA